MGRAIENHGQYLGKSYSYVQLRSWICGLFALACGAFFGRNILFADSARAEERLRRSGQDCITFRALLHVGFGEGDFL